jgi:hypothetical protein
VSYANPLVWYGVWDSPQGLSFLGFHVWNAAGVWRGVYKTFTRASTEAR